MVLASATIDGGVLAVPACEETEEDAHRYVESILNWSQLLRLPWLSVHMSEEASSALVDDNLYPLRAQLSDLFLSKGIVEYDAHTVVASVYHLLQLTPSFEKYFSIQDVCTENLSLEPDILHFCLGTALRSDLSRCIVLIAILRKYCQESVRNHSLILRKASSRIVKVHAYIHALEHTRDDLVVWPEAPDNFEGDVLVCEDFKGLIECLDEISMLLQSPDDIGIQGAIRVAVLKNRLKSGAALDWDEVPEFIVGKKFRMSFKNTGPTRNLASKVLRSIVETLGKINMAATHALRQGSGGNDPQRIRRGDQAKAWRRDIDNNHHLHYWSCPNDIIEIASISFPHDDFSIPEQ